jgi:hypothetical protein
VLPDEALAAARAAEADIAVGRYRGPLHVGLKDIYDTTGVATEGGSKLCLGRVPVLLLLFPPRPYLGPRRGCLWDLPSVGNAERAPVSRAGARRHRPSTCLWLTRGLSFEYLQPWVPCRSSPRAPAFARTMEFRSVG